MCCHKLLVVNFVNPLCLSDEQLVASINSRLYLVAMERELKVNVGRGMDQTTAATLRNKLLLHYP